MISSVRLPGVHRSAPAKSGPPRDTPPKPAPPRPPGWRRWLLPVGLIFTAMVLLGPSLFGASTQAIDYSDFAKRVTAGTVKTVTINDKGAVSGTLKDGKDFTTQIPTALDTSSLASRLDAKGVQVKGTRTGSSFFSVLFGLLPLLLFVGFFVWTGRQARRGAGGLGGLSGIGRSRTKITDVDRPETRFADVAGYEGAKQEISEVVDFLRHPERYQRAGAKGPRGVLMVGPPGTGKTLLARAVAGEAEVPFLSVAGSGFIEMFVGVGASRVRDLFEQARKRAPSIVFIDEVDSIGGRRGGTAIGGNDEREQTLNQLLAEMDGFDQETGVVVLAATNRPETLDAALLRPGRFDRQVTVPLPTQTERAAILAVHARGKSLAPDADLDVIARGTPGFSGADLANLLNEAAIHAVRRDSEVVTADDLDAARDRILLGRRDASNALLPDEKQSVAVHESGHALVAALSPNADPVAKVTILPAGMALGVTEQLPAAERHLYTEGHLYDSLAVRLGGRAAELVVFGHGSTGASSDIAGATELATRMVREFGLSPAVGPVGYGSQDQQFLGGAALTSRPYSDETQRVVDTEVARMLREAEAHAVELLRTHRDALDRLAALLLEKETVDGTAVNEVLRLTGPGDGFDAAEDTASVGSAPGEGEDEPGVAVAVAGADARPAAVGLPAQPTSSV